MKYVSWFVSPAPTMVSMELIIASSTALVLMLVLRQFLVPRRRFPPGPRRLPLVGNLFQIPRILYWEKYHQMAIDFSMCRVCLTSRYQVDSPPVESDLICLDVFGSPMIIIDTLKAAQELIEQRSSIYSSRYVSSFDRPHQTC